MTLSCNDVEVTFLYYAPLFPHVIHLARHGESDDFDLRGCSHFTIAGAGAVRKMNPMHPDDAALTL
jgi:hypothetical protein